MTRTKKYQRDIINNSVGDKAEYKKSPVKASKMMLSSLKITWEGIGNNLKWMQMKTSKIYDMQVN